MDSIVTQLQLTLLVGLLRARDQQNNRRLVVAALCRCHLSVSVWSLEDSTKIYSTVRTSLVHRGNNRCFQSHYHPNIMHWAQACVGCRGIA
ncbi:hypothetical protein BDR05DRAFT_735251 [Suillus weaverae]|nr:hypothetical protein BDR05DRAFT_735251 [Suillus weaverae]